MCLDSIDEIHEADGKYYVLKAIDGKVHILSKSKTEPSQNEIAELVKKRMRNPNNSRYGLNITKVFDTFIIKKQIAGDDYIFGYYDRLEDAEFVRNHLLDNQWNVESFSEIQYDEDKDNYRVVEVIDDKVYVLASFEDEKAFLKKKIKEYDKFYSRIETEGIDKKGGRMGLGSPDTLTDYDKKMLNEMRSMSIFEDYYASNSAMTKKAGMVWIIIGFGLFIGFFTVLLIVQWKTATG